MLRRKRTIIKNFNNVGASLKKYKGGEEKMESIKQFLNGLSNSLRADGYSSCIDLPRQLGDTTRKIYIKIEKVHEENKAQMDEQVREATKKR